MQEEGDGHDVKGNGNRKAPSPLRRDLNSEQSWILALKVTTKPMSLQAVWNMTKIYSNLILWSVG